MKISTYIKSVVLIAGISIIFILFLKYYKKEDIAASEEMVNELNIQKSELKYTDKEIGQIIIDGDYKYVTEVENSAPIEEVYAKAYDYTNVLLDYIDEYRIKYLMKEVVKDKTDCQISTSLFASYLYGEAITFNIVTVCAKWGCIVYEEDTGFVISFEYYVNRDNKQDNIMGENVGNQANFYDSIWTKEQVYNSLVQASDVYYDSLDIKSNINQEYNIEKGIYIISMDVATEDCRWEE